MRAEVYPGADGWRWRVQGRNNEILASGEAYVRRIDAEEVLAELFSGNPLDVTVRDHGGDKAIDHYVLRGKR